MKMATAMILAAYIVAFQVNLASAVVRVCIPLPTRDVAACRAALNTGAPAGTFVCVYGDTPEGCMASVTSNNADLVRFGGEQLYQSNSVHKLVPYVAEAYSATGQGADASVSYYAVAVVKKSLCDELGAGAKFADLKGRSSCHTGYRRTAGWIMPVGHLINTNVMPVVDQVPGVEQDAESVAAFFNNVCAPRTTKDGPGAGGTKWDELCTACKGDCTGNIVTETYNDYAGSLKCLMEGSGDVAWTKHITALEYAKGGAKAVPEWSTLAKEDLRLMCPQSGCQPLDNWGSCNIARAAAHAFVGRPDFGSTAEGAAAIKLLANASEAWLTAMRNFDATAGGNILQATAVGLRLVPTPSDFPAHFGASAVAAFQSIRKLQVPSVRICTANPVETTFCQKLTTIMNAKNLGTSFSCVERISADTCMQAISKNEADMRAFDGNDIYRALTKYNMKAVVSEDYGGGNGISGAQYYSVAVIHKDSCTSNIQKFGDLRGKRVCSTGYRRTAGWSMPTGFLVNSGIMPVVRNDANVEDDAESWHNFFWGGICAPRVSGGGPTKTADGFGAKYTPLCYKCAGDCSDDAAKEPYYDYSGALQCLMKGDGDVAFVKHTTPMDFAKNGATPQPWSALNMEDMRFLCPQGGCAPISQPQQCNMAQVPAHAVMVRADYPDIKLLQSALAAASKDPEFTALAFNGATNPNNHVFKYVTTELVPINVDTRTFLGPALNIFQGLETVSGSGYFPVVPHTTDDSNNKKGLPPGAIAGIAIGCAVAGGIITALLLMLINKRRQSRFTTFNPDHSSSAPMTPFKV